MPFPRIVALQPSVSVTLDALGKLDHLVACTKWCVEQVPRLRKKNLPVLPDSWSSSDADMALLRELQPDLVIACVPYREESLRAILKTGIPVLALAPRSLEEIYADTRLLAAQVNARARGERLIEKMQQALADVSARAAPRTFPLHVFTRRSGRRRASSPSRFRNRGCTNWSAPLAAIRWASLASRPDGRASPGKTPTCCCSPGAAQATACHCGARPTSADGKTSAPCASAGCTACRTSSSTRPPSRRCWMDCPASRTPCIRRFLQRPGGCGGSKRNASVLVRIWSR